MKESTLEISPETESVPLKVTVDISKRKKSETADVFRNNFF